MDQQLFDLTNSVVVVTGGGRGLGAALALGFAEAGARVAIGDQDARTAEGSAAQIRERGGQAAAAGCDITNPQQVRALLDMAQQQFGALDVLVNNAGINIPKPAEELSLEEWSRIVGVNLTGTFIGCQAAGALMLARGSGCIINICSVHGHVGSYVHKAAAYNASKAGVINLTRSLALEWGDRGVRVNGISPGPLRTELMATRLADPDYVRKSLERLALKRVGTPQDVVGAALFLASPAAAWITGQILGVDGGWLAG
ncbi:MAG TPA: SDR family oxidoreductase [Roseiflexaceae bacterium]|nr:SDR family oxidoreductase [Roseiflexaceae bacterium]